MKKHVAKERKGPWARDSTFSKVSLCLHHQECPYPHTHSRSQERNWREHGPLLSLWHASCLNLKRHSLRWMLCLVLNVFLRVLAMWFSASFHDNLIINYTGKMKLHNKPGTRSCHLFFLNPYFLWLHNNPLIRYNVKYQCVNIKCSSFVLLQPTDWEMIS